jgi:hypothetical protein
MIITDWIPTYEFLGYAPNDALEKEIFDKAIEVGAGWKKGNPINPNTDEYNVKIRADLLGGSDYYNKWNNYL